MVENLPPPLNSSAEEPPLFDGTTSAMVENLPPPLNSSAEEPPLFDGSTRLYPCHICSFATPVWIRRNYEVPALEYNGKIIGESLDLVQYVDSNFEGPSLFPDDPEKRKFGEELQSYLDEFIKIVFTSFKGEGPKKCGSAFDHLENALGKFEDGPFFVGQFSGVDVAYIPFIERFQIFLSEEWKYDITAGRPKLAKWIEALRVDSGPVQSGVPVNQTVNITTYPIFGSDQVVECRVTTIWVNEGKMCLVPRRFKAWFIRHGEHLSRPLRKLDGPPDKDLEEEVYDPMDIDKPEGGPPDKDLEEEVYDPMDIDEPEGAVEVSKTDPDGNPKGELDP